jgi:hypothetical protein
MSEDEPDIKRENLADTDESPLGDTTEHAGEGQNEGETHYDPEGESEHSERLEDPPGGEDGAQSARYGEAEAGERVPTPDSEKLANRDDA